MPFVQPLNGYLEGAMKLLTSAVAATLAAVVPGAAHASSAPPPFRNAVKEAALVQPRIRASLHDPKAYCSAPSRRLIQCEATSHGIPVRVDLTKLSPTAGRMCVHVIGDLVAPKCKVVPNSHHDRWF